MDAPDAISPVMWLCRPAAWKSAMPSGNDRVKGAHPDRLKRAHLGLENGRSGQER
jgi:hypothetical protein